MGGTGQGGRTLGTVETYNPQTNTWAAVAPMRTSRGNVGLAAVRGKLYAVGGHDGIGVLHTAETYDPQTDRWEVVAPMACARSAHALAAM